MFQSYKDWKLIQESLGTIPLGLGRPNKIGGVMGSSLQEDLDDIDNEEDDIEDEEDEENPEHEAGETPEEEAEEQETGEEDEDEVGPEKKFPPEEPGAEDDLELGDDLDAPSGDDGVGGNLSAIVGDDEEDPDAGLKGDLAAAGDDDLGFSGVDVEPEFMQDMPGEKGAKPAKDLVPAKGGDLGADLGGDDLGGLPRVDALDDDELDMLDQEPTADELGVGPELTSKMAAVGGDDDMDMDVDPDAGEGEVPPWETGDEEMVDPDEEDLEGEEGLEGDVDDDEEEDFLNQMRSFMSSDKKKCKCGKADCPKCCPKKCGLHCKKEHVETQDEFLSMLSKQVKGDARKKFSDGMKFKMEDALYEPVDQNSKPAKPGPGQPGFAPQSRIGSM